MKFVVDAHLPQGVCDLLKKSGHDAIHTLDMSAQNRTTDETLNILSVNEQRVVITKDTDFYYTHLLHGKPWKLVLVRTGNIRTRDLKALFERHLPNIIEALRENSLVELDRLAVRIVL